MTRSLRRFLHALLAATLFVQAGVSMAVPCVPGLVGPASTAAPAATHLGGQGGQAGHDGHAGPGGSAEANAVTDLPVGPADDPMPGVGSPGDDGHGSHADHGGDASHPVQGPHDGAACSVCAACAIGSALPPAALAVAGPLPGQAFDRPTAGDVATRATDRLDRPPRACAG